MLGPVTTGGDGSIPPSRPLLPWIAFGLVFGALAPDALATAGFPLGAAWAWWLIGLPLSLASAVFPEGMPTARRWLLFASAALLGAWIARPAPPAEPGPRLLETAGEVVSVRRSGFAQGFTIRCDDSAWGRLDIDAPPMPGVLVGDRVQVRGLWSGDGRRPRVDAVAITRLQLREDGARGWAWRAVERSGRHRELAGALLLGSGSPPEKADFRRAGLQHVLAVSGMHLAIAAALSVWLLRLAGVPWLPRLLALAALVLGYLWLTGASPATQRAAAMSLAVVVFALLRREPHRLAAVSLAVVVLVAATPSCARDVGFQLSLAAVAGIVTLGMDLVRERQRLLPFAPWPLDRPVWRFGLLVCRTTLDGLAIGVAAALATAPLVAWHFGSATPWSPLTSLLAAVPATAALWLGLPTLVLGGLLPDGPWHGLYAALEASFSALAAVVAFAARLPAATIAAAPPPVAVALVWPLLFIPLAGGADLLRRAAAVALLIVTWAAC